MLNIITFNINQLFKNLINSLYYFFTTPLVKNTVNTTVLKNKPKMVVNNANVNDVSTMNRVTHTVNASVLQNKNKTVVMMAKIVALVLRNEKQYTYKNGLIKSQTEVITPKVYQRNSNNFKYYFQVSLFSVFPTYSYQVDILGTVIILFFYYTVNNLFTTLLVQKKQLNIISTIKKHYYALLSKFPFFVKPSVVTMYEELNFYISYDFVHYNLQQAKLRLFNNIFHLFLLKVFLINLFWFMVFVGFTWYTMQLSFPLTKVDNYFVKTITEVLFFSSVSTSLLFFITLTFFFSFNTFQKRIEFTNAVFNYFEALLLFLTHPTTYKNYLHYCISTVVLFLFSSYISILCYYSITYLTNFLSEVYPAKNPIYTCMGMPQSFRGIMVFLYLNIIVFLVYIHKTYILKKPINICAFHEALILYCRKFLYIILVFYFFYVFVYLDYMKNIANISMLYKINFHLIVCLNVGIFSTIYDDLVKPKPSFFLESVSNGAYNVYHRYWSILKSIFFSIYGIIKLILYFLVTFKNFTKGAFLLLLFFYVFKSIDYYIYVLEFYCCLFVSWNLLYIISVIICPILILFYFILFIF